VTSLFLLLAWLAGDAAAERPPSSSPTSPVSTLIAAAPSRNKKSGNDDALFCRNEAPMGTRIPTKRCYNKQEFKMRQLDERKALDRIQADARAPVSG
jgi:hypothetical protein